MLYRGCLVLFINVIVNRVIENFREFVNFEVEIGEVIKGRKCLVELIYAGVFLFLIFGFYVFRFYLNFLLFLLKFY